MKVQFIVYAALESLLEKMSTFHNNPKKSPTNKISKYTASGYSLFTNCWLETTKNKLDYYRNKNFMKNLCRDLKEHAANEDEKKVWYP